MTTLIPPHQISWGKHRDSIEVSLHTLSDAVKKELQVMFPTVDVSELVAMPTCQKAQFELVNVGPEVEEEKDRLLECFMSFASFVSDSLYDLGYFCDYIDPCSGLSVRCKDTNKFFDEVSSFQSLLKYETMNAGCCKVLLHPIWGSAVYPATIITNAPKRVVEELLERIQVNISA